MLVALVGIDGCGKSTQAVLLRERWLAAGLRVRVNEVWDILRDPALDASFAGSPQQLRSYLEHLDSVSRCLFIFHALHESFRRAEAEGADVLVVVGYVAKYAVVEELQGTPGGLLKALADLFPAPSTTIWLDLDPSEAAVRRDSYTRYECGGHDPSPETFVAFQEGCQRILGLQAETLGWERVDASGSGDEVHERIIKVLSGVKP